MNSRDDEITVLRDLMSYDSEVTAGSAPNTTNTGSLQLGPFGPVTLRNGLQLRRVVPKLDQWLVFGIKTNMRLHVHPSLSKLMYSLDVCLSISYTVCKKCYLDKCIASIPWYGAIP